MMLEPGTLIDGKYRILRMIGKGGMGMVYEGVNVRIDRRVAIKTMHASLSTDASLVERFEREAQAASRIGSIHIADVLDLGDLPDGQRFMVMEYLDGETLLERTLRLERLPVKMLAPIALQLTEGLAKVHDAGILHRDLKPGNVFLVRTESGADFVKILDFGVCKFREGRGESTALGNLLGTLLYMAPEQLEHGSKGLGPRSDIYAVGIILYRCLAGRFPYDAKNPVALQLEMREGRAPTIAELVPDLDREFAEIVDCATAWDPRARYASAEQMREALGGWLERSNRRERLLSEFLDAEAPPPVIVPAASAPPRRNSSASVPETDFGRGAPPAPVFEPPAGEPPAGEPPAGEPTLGVPRDAPPSTVRMRPLAEELHENARPTLRDGSAHVPDAEEFDIDITVDAPTDPGNPRR